MGSMPMHLPTRPLPRVLALLALLVCAALPLHAENKIPPALPAGQYPAHATQAGITIAADPYDSAPKEKVFRVDYLRYNFIPIRIIVTNDTDKPISLNDVRILLLPAQDGDRINASEPEDVERRVYGRARQGTTIPIGPLKIHKQGKSSDKKIDADFSELEYSALAVEPHTTRAGFLWYDVQGMGQNPLAGATLEFREVRDSSGKEMFAFDLPLDAYLKAQTPKD
jgi:hypothetical protein